jgi:HEAT repeat protein
MSALAAGEDSAPAGVRTNAALLLGIVDERTAAKLLGRMLADAKGTDRRRALAELIRSFQRDHLQIGIWP